MPNNLLLGPFISANGCSRATPILQQRFGPAYSPNGAPYPLRPNSVLGSYQNMDPQREPSNSDSSVPAANEETALNPVVTPRCSESHITQTPPSKTPMVVTTIPRSSVQLTQPSQDPRIAFYHEKNKKEQEEKRIKLDELVQSKSQYPDHTSLREFITLHTKNTLGQGPPSSSTSEQLSAYQTEPSTSGPPLTSQPSTSKSQPERETTPAVEQQKMMTDAITGNSRNQHVPYLHKPLTYNQGSRQFLPYNMTGTIPVNAQNQPCFPVRVKQQLHPLMVPAQQSHEMHAQGIPLPPFVSQQPQQPHLPKTVTGPNTKPLSKYMLKKFAREKLEQQRLQMRLQLEHELNQKTPHEIVRLIDLVKQEQPLFLDERIQEFVELQLPQPQATRNERCQPKPQPPVMLQPHDLYASFMEKIQQSPQIREALQQMRLQEQQKQTQNEQDGSYQAGSPPSDMSKSVPRNSEALEKEKLVQLQHEQGMVRRLALLLNLDPELPMELLLMRARDVLCRMQSLIESRKKLEEQKNDLQQKHELLQETGMLLNLQPVDLQMPSDQLSLRIRNITQELNAVLSFLLKPKAMENYEEWQRKQKQEHQQKQHQIQFQQDQEILNNILSDSQDALKRYGPMLNLQPVDLELPPDKLLLRIRERREQMETEPALSQRQKVMDNFDELERQKKEEQLLVHLKRELEMLNKQIPQQILQLLQNLQERDLKLQSDQLQKMNLLNPNTMDHNQYVQEQQKEEIQNEINVRNQPNLSLPVMLQQHQTQQDIIQLMPEYQKTLQQIKEQHDQEKRKTSHGDKNQTDLQSQRNSPNMLQFPQILLNFQEQQQSMMKHAQQMQLHQQMMLQLQRNRRIPESNQLHPLAMLQQIAAQHQNRLLNQFGQHVLHLSPLEQRLRLHQSLHQEVIENQRKIDQHQLHQLQKQQVMMRAADPEPQEMIQRVQQQLQMQIMQSQQPMGKLQEQIRLQQIMQSQHPAPHELMQKILQQQKLALQHHIPKPHCLEEVVALQHNSEEIPQGTERRKKKEKQMEPRKIPSNIVQQEVRSAQDYQQILPPNFHQMTAKRQNEIMMLHKMGPIIHRFNQLQNQPDQMQQPHVQLELQHLGQQFKETANMTIQQSLQQQFLPPDVPVRHQVVSNNPQQTEIPHIKQLGEPTTHAQNDAESSSQVGHHCLDMSMPTSSIVSEAQQKPPTAHYRQPRKQILEDDNYHSPELYNFLNAPQPIDTITSTINSVANPLFQPTVEAPQEPRKRQMKAPQHVQVEPTQVFIGPLTEKETVLCEMANFDQQFTAYAATDTSPETCVTPNVRSPQSPKPPPEPKKKPGRPRKHSLHNDDVSLSPTKKTRKHDSDENEDTKNEEHLKLLGDLPSNVLDALKRQKEQEMQDKIMREAEIANQMKPKRKYTKKIKPTPTAVPESQLPLEDDMDDGSELRAVDHLRFLDLASKAISGEGAVKKRRGRPPKEKKLSNEELEALKKAEEEINRKHPPVATAVATFGVPLTLNVYENPPKFIEAPVWTDETGPLVPDSLYRTDVATVNEPEVPKPIVEPEMPYRPRIVTKAALKFMAPPLDNKGPVLGDFDDFPQRLADFFQPLQKFKPDKDGIQKVAPQLRMRFEIDRVTDPMQHPSMLKWAEYFTPNPSISKTEQLLNFIFDFLEDLRSFSTTLYHHTLFANQQDVLMEEEERRMLEINSVYDKWVHAWTQFKSNDSQETVVKLRWLQWNVNMLTTAIKQSKQSLIRDKLEQSEIFKTYAHEEMKHLSPVQYTRAHPACIMIQATCSQLRRNLDSISDLVLDTETLFQAKWKAVEQRHARYSNIKEQYKRTTLKQAFQTWKRATYRYINTFDIVKREEANRKMCDAFLELALALSIFDAVVDVCQYALRLRILCEHLMRSIKEGKNSDRNLYALRQIEKTEFLLMIAETKSMLLQSPNYTDQDVRYRINVCSAFIKGASMNVEKNKLRRMMRTGKSEDVIKMCEKLVEARAEIFSRSLEVINEEKARKLLPDKSWTEVIIDELKGESANEKLKRAKFFNKNGHIMQEMTAEFFDHKNLSYALSEIAFTQPIQTNIEDEEIAYYLDKDKMSLKKEIRDLCQKLPNEAEELQWRHAYCKRYFSRAEKKEIQMIHLRENDSAGDNDGEILDGIRALVRERENAGEDSIERKKRLEDKIKAFREEKRNQARIRSQFLENLNRRSHGIEEPDTRTRIIREYNMQYDLTQAKEAAERYGFDSDLMPFMKGYDYFLQEDYLADFLEKESDEDVDEIIITIKNKTQQLQSAKETEQEELQMELKDLTERFRLLHKEKKLKRQAKSAQLKNAPLSIPKLSKEFYTSVKNLEHYVGRELDSLIANEDKLAAIYGERREEEKRNKEAVNNG